MSRNLPGTRSYALPDAERPRPRHAVSMPRELWAELDAEAERRNIARSRLLEEAAVAWLPTSRAMPHDDEPPIQDEEKSP